MFSCVLSEHLKYKGTFTKKLTWIAPIFTILFSIILAPGKLYQISSYNYWYALILPGALTLICGGVIDKDAKKLKYRALLSLPIDLSKLWVAKIIVCIWFYFLSCVVSFIGINLFSFVWGRSISFSSSIEGSILLFVTVLWLIPLTLFLIEQLGMVITLLINIACNILGVLLALEASWLNFPYAIPSRLMCSVIGALPNGMPVPVNSPLNDRNVILAGVMSSIVLFIILLVLTSLLFRKREAK